MQPGVGDFDTKELLLEDTCLLEIISVKQGEERTDILSHGVAVPGSNYTPLESNEMGNHMLGYGHELGLSE